MKSHWHAVNDITTKSAEQILQVLVLIPTIQHIERHFLIVLDVWSFVLIAIDTEDSASDTWSHLQSGLLHCCYLPD